MSKMKHKKALVIACLLVLYFSLLTWISHVRQPAEPPESVSDNQAASDYLNRMSCSRKEMFRETGIVLSKVDDVMFGPYITAEPGEHKLLIQLSCKTPQKLSITADSGKRVLRELQLADGVNEIPMTFDESVEQVEFVIRAASDEVVTVKRVEFD